MFNISLKQPDPGFNVILFQDDATTSTGYTLTGVLGLNVSLLTGSYSGSAGFNPNVIDLEVSLLGGQTDYGINYSSDLAGLVVSLTGDASSFTPISTGYTATGLFDLGISFIGTGAATTSGSALYSGENPLFLTVSMSGASGSATTGDVEVGSAASFSGSVIPLNISLLTGSVSFGTGVSISGSPLLLVVNNTGSSFSAGLNISSDLLIISGSIPAATGSGGANYSGTSPSILNLSLLEPSASTAESPTIRRYAGDRFTCLSTDVKPLDVTDGALLHVLDTRYCYLKVSGAWVETSASWSGAGTGSSGSYTDEEAQDAVGNILTGELGVYVEYDDASNIITIGYTSSVPVSSYLATTFTGQTSVNVSHSFGVYPVVQVLDNTSSVIIPLSITNNSVNDYTVLFSASTTGTILSTVGSPSNRLTNVSSHYNILSTDFTINCTANSFTVNLPTSVGAIGRIYNIKDSGTGTITIGTTSAQTIDAYTSGALSLSQYERVTVQSDGANWIII